MSISSLITVPAFVKKGLGSKRFYRTPPCGSGIYPPCFRVTPHFAHKLLLPHEGISYLGNEGFHRSAVAGIDLVAPRAGRRFRAPSLIHRRGAVHRGGLGCIGLAGSMSASCAGGWVGSYLAPRSDRIC